ncbi:MAG: hypothetical protein BYD32DRAFT_422528 [Podila humilis]|nr:MAG: hypothetical protein BYD32DRAFT_422528 [Podila humilis]
MCPRLQKSLSRLVIRPFVSLFSSFSPMVNGTSGIYTHSGWSYERLIFLTLSSLDQVERNIKSASCSLSVSIYLTHFLYPSLNCHTACHVGPKRGFRFNSVD